MEPWENVVEIPAGKLNDHEISHFTRPAGKVERSNLRTAMFGGQGDEPLVFDRETTWHELSYEGGTWMTDLPIEQEQHDQLLAPIDSGSVLIGGLGLGYAVNVLAAREDVDRIVVVELSPEVVVMVGPHVKDPEGKVEIVCADLFDYLGDNTEYFDWAFYDIWQSDGEGTFFNVVWPLRQLSEGWIDDCRVICWNENIMRGQLMQSLTSRWAMAQMVGAGESIPGLAGFSVEEFSTPRPVVEIGAFWWNWSVPFWRGMLNEIVTEENFHEAAGAYAGTFGHAGFEEWWGLVERGVLDL